MDFWFFNLSTGLVIPVLMIVFGSIFVKRAPKKINLFYGYRTTMSMKNRGTWEFAHHYFGRIWRLAGWILFLLSAGTMLLMRGKDEAAVNGSGSATVLVQAAVLLATIAPTERALRRTFDKNGN